MRIDGSKILNPGLLRHRIEWQRKAVAGQNEVGEDVFGWVKFVATPARVVAIAGRELELARQRWAEARFRVEMQYVAGIEREMRGVWGARYLDVLDTEDPAGMGMTLYAVCKEWTP